MNQVKHPKAAPERRQGRPVKTGQRDLKEHILAAAEQLFTDQGYGATSIRSIADKADVNPALVHYYFGNKHALLKSVLEHALKPMIDAMAGFNSAEGASVDDITAMLISMAAEHPNIPRLLTREVLLPGGEMQDYFAENLAPQLGGALPVLLAREKSAGNLHQDIDPAYASMMLLGLCMFPFVARSLAEPILGIDFGKDGAATLTRHVSNLLNRGMTS
jgi:TetR/AcrR family transcriptional regulator